ncbi:MAG TPA: lipopolysaccharide transport periplasmic protein LptA [Candidatus Aquabacterium excrementipullorum]|nr:lipopolysaccharide transport periplasmic protein LptA [Candidatus Aquabacterium excrementipullorum]
MPVPSSLTAESSRSGLPALLTVPAARRLSLAALAVLSLAAAPAWADRSDRFQPLNFAADNARVDDNQRVNVLTGNVEITKGTIVLRAARVEVRQVADGSQMAVATNGAGGRAYFRQRREGLDEYIEGEAERIEYDGQGDKVYFKGRAVMRRLNGATVADEVVGQSIVYDNKTEVFQVAGGASGGGTTGSPTTGGRVRGVIAPRNDAASAPRPATSRDGAKLAPSGTLSQPALESTR